MDTKFQTSFIPRKPLMPDQGVRVRNNSGGGGTSIFMMIGILAFLVSIGGAVFVFVAKGSLMSSQDQMIIDLKEKQRQFDTSEIEAIKKANTKIDIAKEILGKHVTIAEIFNIIAGLTIEGVYFQNLEISTGDSSSGGDGTYKVSMKGLANSYSSVAWQSDVFGRSEKYGTNKVIKNPILSNIIVDEDDNVSFDFSADISQTDISYEKVLNDTLKSEGLIIEDLIIDRNTTTITATTTTTSTATTTATSTNNQ